MYLVLHISILSKNGKKKQSQIKLKIIKIERKIIDLKDRGTLVFENSCPKYGYTSINFVSNLEKHKSIHLSYVD